MRITAIYPDYLDATSWYRGAGPMAELIRQFPGIDVSTPGSLAWPQLAMTDVLFMQRPHNDDHLRAIQQAKQMGVKVWVDWDDNPFCVPLSNPSWEGYAKPGTRETIVQMIQAADLLTVSTPALAEAMKKANRNIHLIPNALDTRHVPMPEKRPQTTKTVVWRGSATHDEDLDRIGAQYRALIQKHKDWKFVFMGHLPWRIAGETRIRTFENVRYYTVKSVMGYFTALREIAPRIMVVPLVDDEFNRCKSNIAWIEGTVAGAVIQAPPMPEWEKPGCWSVHPDDFAGELSAAMSDDDYQKLWSDSRAYILANLTLEQTTTLRVRALESIA